MHGLQYGIWKLDYALQWRHKRRDGVSNHQLQPFIQTQINGNIKAPRHWPLCGEFNGDRWIPRINGQLHGKCFNLMTLSLLSTLVALCGGNHGTTFDFTLIGRVMQNLIFFRALEQTVEMTVIWNAMTLKPHQHGGDCSWTGVHPLPHTEQG